MVYYIINKFLDFIFLETGKFEIFKFIYFYFNVIILSGDMFVKKEI